MSLVIKAVNLTKTYSDGTRAIDGISFQVAEGEIFGFLGPNGAGKTTTIQVLTGLTTATSGHASICGMYIDRNVHSIKRIVGVVHQRSTVDYEFPTHENMMLQGQLYGLTPKESKARCNEFLTLLGLDGTRSPLYLSGGNRRRLDVALALIHRPRILFLDEPTVGLDLQTRIILWEYLTDLRNQGVTLFLTTQYLEEADRMADRLVIINNGRTVAEGTPADLKARFRAETLDDVFLACTGGTR